MTNTTDQNPSAEQRNNPMNGLSQMVYKRWINLFELHPSDVNIETIAHSLARLCRYNGQVAGFISVGRHSLRCAQKAYTYGYGNDVALQALCHDFGEAFFGDLVRPLKNDPEMRARYLEIEHAGEIVICEALDITYPFDPRVKELDMADSQLEMGANEDGERFNPLRWDDVNDTEYQIIQSYHQLIKDRNYDRFINASRNLHVDGHNH